MNNMKIAGIFMVVLAAIMIAMGLKLIALPGLNPPIVSGIGFLVIAAAFFTHKH